FAPVEVDLQRMDPAADIRDLPIATASFFVDSARLNRKRESLPQEFVAGGNGAGLSRDQHVAAAAERRFGKTVAAAEILNVAASVNGCCHPAKALLFDRCQKRTRIVASAKTRRAGRRHIETALGSKARFLRRVINRAEKDV